MPAPITLKCPLENTIHLQTESPLVRHYSNIFLSQFGWTIRQGKTQTIDGAIYHQPGLNWGIGWNQGKLEMDLDKTLKYSEIKALFNTPKSKLISVICSTYTPSPQHRARLRFVRKLKKYYGSKIDFFGRGFNTMDDKIVALKDYRFHVTLENSSYDHYFSEKLSDCILAGTYPIYYGCPNINDYFPRNSYQHIDIQDFKEAVKIIDRSIEKSYDKIYRQELLTARNLVLNQYNLFPMLIEIIHKIEDGQFGKPSSPQISDSVLLPLAQDKEASPIRRKISSLADNYQLVGHIRRIYHSIKYRKWDAK